MKTILPSKTAEVLITQKCNLNCTYCFEKCKSNRDLDVQKFFLALGEQKDFLENPCDSFYVFGGEPLMNPSFYERAVDFFDKREGMPENVKAQYIKTICENITTNGTLISKELELLRKFKCSLQVSLDGPEYINDACRVDHSGRGHFKQIQENLARCREYGIPYSLHGALSRVNYSHYFEINKFFISEEFKKTEASYKDSPEYMLNHNYLQIVFEDDISDEDIDIFLKEVGKTVDYLLTSSDLAFLTPKQRKELTEGFLMRKGGVCSAGGTMYTYDDEFNVFPCHRLSTSVENKEDIKFSSLEKEKSWNWNVCRQFQEVFLRKEMNSALFLNNFKNTLYGVNWCPATNWETSGSTFHIPSKYSVLIIELTRYSKALASYYGLNLQNSKFLK